MKDYIKTGRKIQKIVCCSINQCGAPSETHQVNLHIKITEPYVIGYNLYVAYSFNRWSIDYSYNPIIDVRINMEHISDIKTETEMLKAVEDIVNNIRKNCGVM